ncbi:hypothetical protein ACFSUJ_35085 [Streptomyces lusitanus]|uniref:hypothetical protein n=1 Tax=Streptomyces lusitanus TaxID=68232 RepID=UPI0036396D6E
MTVTETSATALHDDAVRTLEGWRTADAGQDRLRRDYLAHLAGHPDGLFRACLPAHITASALVVDPASGGCC